MSYIIVKWDKHQKAFNVIKDNLGHDPIFISREDADNYREKKGIIDNSVVLILTG